MQKIKSILTISLAILIPFISLTIATFFLPNVMSADNFGLWRILASVCAFSGIAHLGFVDGIYLKWIGGAKNSSTDGLKVPFLSIVWMSLLFSLLGSLYIYHSVSNSIDYKIILSFVFLMSLSTNLYSASVNYLRAFSEGISLTLLISMQSIIFTACVIILHGNSTISWQWMAIIYSISMLITPLFLSRRVFSLTSVNIKSFMIGGGTNLMLGNFGLILFSNLDKIYVVSQFKDIREFARYSIASSLIVAASTIGSSAGQMFLSKKIFNRVNYNFILSILLILIILYVMTRNIMENLFDSIFPRYDIEYSVFILSSILVFYYSSILYTKMISMNIKLYSSIQIFGSISYITIYTIFGIFYRLDVYDRSALSILLAIFINIVIALVLIRRESK